MTTDKFGGSNPLPRSKVKTTSQGGGANTTRHAGPGRPSKTPPAGTRGAQLQKSQER
jgi:hypothetical protein